MNSTKSGRIGRRIGIAGTIVVTFIMGSLIMLSWLQNRPDKLGLADGKLHPCQNPANCVCSEFSGAASAEPISFTGSASAAMARLVEIVGAMPGAKVISQDENYLHVEFSSRVFGFIDDVEFRIDEAASAIHFRSASRIGLADLGVNRNRMQQIREEFRDQS